MNQTRIGPNTLAAIAAGMTIAPLRSRSPKYYQRGASENATRTRNRKRNKIAKAARRRNRK